MSGSREYGRKRSNTQSSIHGSLSQVRVPVPPPQPLEIGDSCTLTAWIHPEDDRTVRLNPDAWPGIKEGDLVEVTAASDSSASNELSFVFPANGFDETRKSPRLQVSNSSIKLVSKLIMFKISIPKKLAERFKIDQYDTVICTKVAGPA